jgi:hypothetical protein
MFFMSSSASSKRIIIQIRSEVQARQERSGLEPRSCYFFATMLASFFAAGAFRIQGNRLARP